MNQRVLLSVLLAWIACVHPSARGDDAPAASGPVLDFTNDVMPLISRLGCNQAACHGSVQGKGGLQLSLFGGDAADDYAALTLAAARTACESGGAGEEPVVGQDDGRRFLMVGDTKVQVGSARLQRAAARGLPRALRGATSTVHASSAFASRPANTWSRRAVRSRWWSTALFSDGTQKDVTRDTLFRSSDAAVASVAEGGLVKAESFGEATIVASYLRQFAVVRIVVPQPLPSPWVDVPPNNRIDELVFAKLKKLGIPPSDLCTDQEFMRRVYLDVIGTLPQPDEVRAFLADTDPQKRSKLIDQLLMRDEFADFWSLKWGDLLRIKSEYPVNVWPKAVQVYYRWLHESLRQNKPYDQFVRELLTSDGSNFRSPPANFFRAMPGRTPQAFAETTALVFMGARFNCVRCHAHPSETWTLDDDLGMAAFFTKVAIKATQEWKEEIVYFNADGGIWHPRTKQLVKPKVLGGEPLELGPEEDPRVKFADWLTSPQNPWFARNAVNRVWTWLLGRGIVHAAGRLSVDQSAGESGTAGVPEPGTGQPPVRSAAHLSPDPQFAHLPVVVDTPAAQRAGHGALLALSVSSGWVPNNCWMRLAR